MKLLDYINRKKRLAFTCFCLIVVLSFLSCYKSFRYGFWRDDWVLIWQALYDRANFLKWILGIRHPGEIFNTYALAPIFGQQVLLWQYFGFILKVLVSLVSSFVLYSLIGSKKGAFISSLLIASSFIGLEGYNWISARLNVYVLLVCLIATLFYIESKKMSSIKYYIYSLIFLIFGMFMEPGRVIFLPFVLISWEITVGRIENSIFKFINLIRMVFIIIATLAGALTTSYGRTLLYGGTSGYIQNLQKDNSAFLRFFYSLSNLILIYIKGIRESAGLSTGFNRFDAYIGLLLVVLLILSGLFMFVKKEKNLPVFVVSSLWLLLFFAPGWISDMSVSLSESSRFFTISSVGFTWILTLIVLKFSPKICIVVTILLIFTNLLFSNKIQSSNYNIRSFEIANNFYRTQQKYVSGLGTPLIFIVTGDNILKGYIFDWGTDGSVQFSYARSIKQIEKIPIYGIDYKLAAKLICEKNVNRPFINEWGLQTDKVTIDEVYGWNLNKDGNLDQTIDKTRIKVAHEGDCLFRNIDKTFNNRQLIIKSYFLLKHPYNDVVNSVSSFKVINIVKNAFEVNVLLYEKGKLITKYMQKVDQISSVGEYYIYIRHPVINIPDKAVFIYENQSKVISI